MKGWKRTYYFGDTGDRRTLRIPASWIEFNNATGVEISFLADGTFTGTIIPNTKGKDDAVTVESARDKKRHSGNAPKQGSANQQGVSDSRRTRSARSPREAVRRAK